MNFATSAAKLLLIFALTTPSLLLSMRYDETTKFSAYYNEKNGKYIVYERYIKELESLRKIFKAVCIVTSNGKTLNFNDLQTTTIESHSNYKDVTIKIKCKNY